jgi:hypothetical protein
MYCRVCGGGIKTMYIGWIEWILESARMVGSYMRSGFCLYRDTSASGMLQISFFT